MSKCFILSRQIATYQQVRADKYMEITVLFLCACWSHLSRTSYHNIHGPATSNIYKEDLASHNGSKEHSTLKLK